MIKLEQSSPYAAIFACNTDNELLFNFAHMRYFIDQVFYTMFIDCAVCHQPFNDGPKSKLCLRGLIQSPCYTFHSGFDLTTVNLK